MIESKIFMTINVHILCCKTHSFSPCAPNMAAAINQNGDWVDGQDIPSRLFLYAQRTDALVRCNVNDVLQKMNLRQRGKEVHASEIERSYLCQGFKPEAFQKVKVMSSFRYNTACIKLKSFNLGKYTNYSIRLQRENRLFMAA